MKRKIAVSVPEEVARRVEVEVRAGNAASVSAYVTDALERMGRHEQLAEVLARMDKELGRPSARDKAWARHVLGL
ncbi:MAG: toxin-antitoxin system antitoxin subunit [Chloroflexota bacterium]